MTPDALRPALPGWGLPEDAALRLIHFSENATFRAEHAGHALVLRLHRVGYHTEREIRAGPAWLEALAAARVTPTVTPIAGANGDALQTVRLDGVQHRLVAFTAINGREPDPGNDLTTIFADLGAIAGCLQRHTRGWTPPPGFTRKRLDSAAILGPMPHRGDWRAAPGLHAPGRATLERLAADLTLRLAEYGCGPAHFGLIHADLRLANLLVDADRIWPIDFDDCGFGWWMYDFAAAFSFIEDDPRLPELARAWTEGYARILPLAPEDRAILPVMVMLRRLLLTAWIASHADSDPAQALGGPVFIDATVALADRLLAHGPQCFWADAR